MDQRFAIKFLLRKMMDPKDIIKEMKETYREECYSDSQIYFWIRQIKCGRQDLSDLPKPGRPVDEQLTVTIQKAFNKNQFASARSVARKIGVSHTTVLKIKRKNRLKWQKIF